MTRWISCFAAMLMSLMSVCAAAAGPVLTVEAPGGVITFDMANLRELPSVTFETETIWTDGLQTFTGVPLAALTQHLGSAAVGSRRWRSTPMWWIFRSATLCPAGL